MTKTKLRVVPPPDPVGPLTLEQKRERAIKWLRTSGPESKWVLDKGSKRPEWGHGKSAP